eukprot:3082498-Prymnesium_polylepis.1
MSPTSTFRKRPTLKAPASNVPKTQRENLVAVQLRWELHRRPHRESGGAPQQLGTAQDHHRGAQIAHLHQTLGGLGRANRLWKADRRDSDASLVSLDLRTARLDTLRRSLKCGLALPAWRAGIGNKGDDLALDSCLTGALNPFDEIAIVAVVIAAFGKLGTSLSSQRRNHRFGHDLLEEAPALGLCLHHGVKRGHVAHVVGRVIEYKLRQRSLQPLARRAHEALDVRRLLVDDYPEPVLQNLAEARLPLPHEDFVRHLGVEDALECEVLIGQVEAQHLAVGTCIVQDFDRGHLRKPRVKARHAQDASHVDCVENVHAA